MITNNLGKSTRFRDIGVSEFLIRLVAHEDIRFFSYNRRKA